ncbi:hypothetical protein [Psychromonas aquimarina]|uniref:hypothetical protein n=1 Tax=Psychromonas aquimarina TaxID=444919 RepID=UPI00041643F2|nr:hypothetical protein [Psychromonas aquimarina]
MTVETILAKFKKDESNNISAFKGKSGSNRYQISLDISKRISNPHKIQQRSTSLCGAVVFLQCIAKKHPEVYAQYIIDLFEKGEASIGKLQVKPSRACKSLFKDTIPRATIVDVDWIGLASLRDSTNTLFNYDHPSDQLAGITTPGCLAGWFKKTELFGSVENETNLIFDKGSRNLLQANLRYSTDYHVCLFVGSKILVTADNIKLKKGSAPADHWVILNSKVLLDNMPANLDMTSQVDVQDKKISFNIQTWGNNQMPVNKANTSLKVSEFLDYYYGYVCVK